MDFSTPCQIHQINHAFTPITLLKINPSLRDRPLQLQSIDQSQDSRDYYPVLRTINNYHCTIPSPNLNSNMERRGVLLPKQHNPNDIFFRYQTPPHHQDFIMKLFSPKMLWRFLHLPLDSSNTHEWIPLNPPACFLINKTSSLHLQTPSHTFTNSHHILISSMF